MSRPYSLRRRLVWLHGVVMYHYESISRDNAVHDWEKELICRRWGDYRRIPERFSTNVRAVVKAARHRSRSVGGTSTEP